MNLAALHNVVAADCRYRLPPSLPVSIDTALRCLDWMEIVTLSVI